MVDIKKEPQVDIITEEPHHVQNVEIKDEPNNVQIVHIKQQSDVPVCMKLEIDPMQDFTELPVEFENDEEPPSGSKLGSPIDLGSEAVARNGESTNRGPEHAQELSDHKKQSNEVTIKRKNRTAGVSQVSKVKHVNGIKTKNLSNDGLNYTHFYHCDICNKTFSEEKKLTAHSRKHLNKAPLKLVTEAELLSGIKKCSQCNKMFKTDYELTAHERKHAGEKPYECKVCSKRFNQTCHLKAHERIHTGEKPFECPACDKKFSQKSHLKTHLQTH